MGIRDGDFSAIERTLDAMPRHQADDRRSLTPGGTTGKEPSAWASLPCDHFAILEVLLLFGRKNAPGVDRALDQRRDLPQTPAVLPWVAASAGRRSISPRFCPARSSPPSTATP